jgi:hypothetical protein
MEKCKKSILKFEIKFEKNWPYQQREMEKMKNKLF